MSKKIFLLIIILCLAIANNIYAIDRSPHNPTPDKEAPQKSKITPKKVFGDVEVTIGQDAGTSEAIEKLGATHVKTTHGEVIIDEKNNLFTTPCYMLDANILDIAKGASNIVKVMLEQM